MQKAWHAWTFVDFGQKRSGPDGRAGGVGWGDATDYAGMGFGAIRDGSRWRLQNRGKSVLSRPRSLHPV